MAAGWQVQDRRRANLGAAAGVAIREFPLATGEADYLLFVHRKAIGGIEAKPEGATLSGVEMQSGKYSIGLPPSVPAWHRPLPFLYESTGAETFFTNGLDPQPRSRRVFAFHRPETLAEWADDGRTDRRGGVSPPGPPPGAQPGARRGPATDDRGEATSPLRTLRGQLRQMPPLITAGLWDAQVEAITNLEASLADDRPRALVQMATGSGKTFTAVSAIYRLIKFGGARRVLFLVDRSNLGRQTLKEFQQYVTPDDGRKFTELYNVQRLTSNVLDPVSRVIITTIQRLYSILSGEAELDPAVEEKSWFDMEAGLAGPPVTVTYNPRLPIEFFDMVFTDECHRSIYNLWRQVLEYFDAHLVGLTATPSKQTLGFFGSNLVMEYPRTRAVADGVNVDGQVYRIRTEITERGSTVDAGYFVDKRDRLTRAVRWEQLDDDFTYTGSQLDRDVVAENQIRAVIRTYRDKLFTDLFPGRTEVPKTLVFAKDDSHAEDIVRIIREEFAKGNEFCQKITYRVTGVDAEELIASFRNSYHPRIAVTVDMISTGTDIKPLEVLLFMRPVKSRVLFEQMLGRGTRVISATDLQAVTPDAATKTHFVIVDAVGVVEQEKVDTQTLERKRTVSFAKLLESVAWGVRDPDTLTSLAGRLARLERTLTEGDRRELAPLIEGRTLRDLANALLDAVDPDVAEAPGGDVGATGRSPVPDELVERATAPFDDPQLRSALIDIHRRAEQVIDRVSLDRVTEAGFDAAATDRARATVESFRQFIEEHRDEITALQIIYGRPYGQQRLTYAQVKELAGRLAEAQPNWTTEALWWAYVQLEKDRVSGAAGQRVLTDLVSLVRHAVQLDDELAPYPRVVRQRYESWLAGQEAAGRHFTATQRWWLDKIAEHIGVNLAMTPDDFDLGEFFDRGGQLAARKQFGRSLPSLLEELNAVLVA